MASRLSPTIHPEKNAVRFNGIGKPLAGEVPLFGGLSGNSFASAAVSCPKDPVGAFTDLPGHDIRREAEGAVDCWGKGSRSGSTIRGTVLGIIATGAFR